GDGERPRLRRRRAVLVALDLRLRVGELVAFSARLLRVAQRRCDAATLESIVLDGVVAALGAVRLAPWIRRERRVLIAPEVDRSRFILELIAGDQIAGAVLDADAPVFVL